jgi:C_GCAxxG_C_C family probable redox protein
MSKFTEKAKALRAIEIPHYNCAQSVLIPFAEAAGITEETAYRVAANFGGGMKRGSVCGAVTGGLMALGLFGADDPRTVSEFHLRMKLSHNGVLDCAELLKVNAEAGGDKKQHCDDMVTEAVALVEELLMRAGKLPAED